MKTMRSILLIISLVGLIFLLTCHENKEKDQSNISSKYPSELRIGYQKGDTLMYLKKEKIFENAFKDRRIHVSWKEFPSGPPMLEALNSGSIDLASTGDTPPIFAQASGVDLVYIARDEPSIKTKAILIPKNSLIKEVKDLKGKKVALTRGSSAHYTLLKALQDEGIDFKDVEVVYFQPSEARVAFESKKIDAWVIWDPYLVAAEIQLNAIRLANSTDLMAQNRFYLVTKNFSEQYSSLISEIIKLLEVGNKGIKENLDEYAEDVSKATRLPLNIAQLAVKNRAYGIYALDENVQKEQQKIADTFYQQGLIPNPIIVKDLFWNF